MRQIESIIHTYSITHAIVYMVNKKSVHFLRKCLRVCLFHKHLAWQGRLELALPVASVEKSNIILGRKGRKKRAQKDRVVPAVCEHAGRIFLLLFHTLALQKPNSRSLFLCMLEKPEDTSRKKTTCSNLANVQLSQGL